MRIYTNLFFTLYDYARIRFASIFVCLRRFTQITVSWNFTYNPTTFESHGSVASFHTCFLFSFINMSTVSFNNITWNSSAVECLLHSGASQCKEKILGDIGVHRCTCATKFFETEEGNIRCIIIYSFGINAFSVLVCHDEEEVCEFFMRMKKKILLICRRHPRKKS